ncbi:MAG: GntR family transcriptional regulator [Pirellulales bacterium]|nr:GntR family transcriptional regulator [Pirellulales bacterium]
MKNSIDRSLPTFDSDSMYDRVVQHIFFSGGIAPGAKVVERRLADELGVSRIPIREILRQLAGQGLLVSDESGQGTRLRKYTAEEIRQLYELRELLEGGAARAAAKVATDTDVARLDMINDKLDTLIENFDTKLWADFDHAFHTALADASHNERIARSLKQLLTECHCVFYLHPSHFKQSSAEERVAHLREVVEDHKAILKLICDGECDGAERKAREVMRASSVRFTKALILADLTEK